MSTKPTDLPTWATDATYSSGPESGEDTKIEPSAGFQAEGFKPATYPRPEHFNWYMNLVYLWAQYLNDGAFSGNHSFANDVAITGALTLTGAFKHGNEIRIVGGSDGKVYVGTWNVMDPSVANALLTAGGAITHTVTFPVDTEVGDRIKSVTLRMIGNGTVDITAYDISYCDSTGPHSIGSGSQNNISTSFQALTHDVTDHTMVAGESLLVTVTVNGSGFQIHAVEVTYDRP